MVFFTVLFLFQISVLFALPISAQYRVGVRLLDYNSENYHIDFFEQTYADASLNSNGIARVYGNLKNGTVGSYAAGDHGIGSIVSIFDIGEYLCFCKRILPIEIKKPFLYSPLIQVYKPIKPLEDYIPQPGGQSP